MKHLFLFLLVTLPLSIHSCFAQSNPDTVLHRYQEYLFKTTSLSNIEKLTRSLNENGEWPDINYADTQRGNWQLLEHLKRLRNLSIAWANPRSTYYNNPELWKSINAALDNWLENRYQNKNWWHNQIGVPQNMRDIIILIRTHLSPEKLKQALQIMDQLKVAGTGANLIWSADLGLHYGALTRDTALMNKCSQLIISEIKITTGDGIQPDYSFHQHGTRLQMFQYGASFLQTNIRLAWELRKTSWAFPPSKLNILANLILKGWQWMARGINTVPGTMDRSVSREGALHSADLRTQIPFLCDLIPSKKSAWLALADRQNGKGNALKGFRYYPYSDFAAYQTPYFSFFLKTISNRTLATESINSENLKGKLLNSGDAYLVRDGEEYFNIMPVWDWNFLPGVTSFNGAEKIDRKPFSGGVSDGKSGLIAMDYRMIGKENAALSAHKCWMSYHHVTVCLIADLKAGNISGNVYTALDQCRLRGKVILNSPDNVVQDSDHLYQNVHWIYHQSGFTYLPLNEASVHLQLKTATGSWSAINASQSPAMHTEKVFLPVMIHSHQQPSTGYVLAYCPSAAQAAALYAHPTWKILRNDDACQAVAFKNGPIMAAFFSADSLKLPNQVILTTDQPCLIHLLKNTLYISNPLHTSITVTLHINHKLFRAKLPDDGSSYSINLSKK